MKLVLALVAMAAAGGAAGAQEYVLRQDGDRSVALKQGDRIVWQWNVGGPEGKPFVHPMTLPDGTVLTDLRPKDHVWHLALWWSWKYLDGVNYWEPGRGGKPDGETKVTSVKITPAGNEAKVETDLLYRPRDSERVVLSEKRTWTFLPPDKDGGYRIDALHVFTAGDKPVKLDRTPIPGQPGGVSYGGYAGFSIRMPEATRTWAFRGSEGGTGLALHGKPARWMDFSRQASEGRPAGEGVAIFDHPKNPRHPTPWVVIPSMPYFSPAFLFNEPMTLPAGETLTLRYRVWVHAGPAGPEALEREWKAFAGAVHPGP